jgi:hypothetical protein
MNIEEAFAIMHPTLYPDRMQHHDKCHHGLSTWFPKTDCKACELFAIIDGLQAELKTLSTELARLERVYAGGL